MNRKIALQEICQKYPYQKNALKLSESQFDEMVAWLEDHDHLGHLEFEYAVNRMFLGGSLIKPKNQSIIQDLLTSANSRVHVRSK